MSTGLFMGIRSSFIPEAQNAASDFIYAINHILNSRGVPPYIDPIDPPNVYNGHLFGRSELDHHSSRVIQKIAGIGCSARNSPNLALIFNNPFRVAYVPIDFSPPSPTAFHDRIGGERIQIWVGSLPHLLAELRWLAADLRIPLSDGDITGETAAAINDWKSLYAGDPLELAEDERTAWLAIYEGARLASQHNVALSLAG